MVMCEFYENNKCFKRVKMPAVPRIGEAIVIGYGSEYCVMRVVDVTWDADPPGDAHATARLSLQPST